MHRLSNGFPGRSRSRSGWPLVGMLLAAGSLSLMSPRETATLAPLQEVRTEPQYELELIPDLKQAEPGERFDIDLWVTDATPGLDMNKIEFLLEVIPGRVTIPDVIYSDPGDFIPDAFLVILDSTHTAECTSARYRITAFEGGSSSPGGWLATLAFDAVSEGTTQLVISSVLAYDSNLQPLESPAQATGALRIGAEVTGLPFDGSYVLTQEKRRLSAVSRQSMPVRFVVDDWCQDDALQEAF